jgi:hypothetical protein
VTPRAAVSPDRAEPPRERAAVRRVGIGGSVAAMTILRSHLLLAGAGLAALALCVSSVAAKPTGKEESALPQKNKSIDLKGIDPAIAKQLSPRMVKADEQLELQKKTVGDAFVPQFNVRHIDGLARAKLVGVNDPESLPGPRVFTARTTYHDDQTYMEILAYNGASLGVRPLRNYYHFMGSPEVMGSPSLRPSLLIHFRALANTRYLLECAVDGQTATTFFASDNRGEYTVHTDDRATLLYMRNQGATFEDVVVQVSGNADHWYLDSCELTASRQ